MLSACLRLGGGWLGAAEAVAPRNGEPGMAPGVLTNFDQIWQLSDAAQHERHRVQFKFAVYYYDPLWQAMWGRCGDADSYLSLGSKVFPIKAGQLILVEGWMQPANGMRVDDARVTVLAATTPVEVRSTNGRVGATERFNKRLVTLEGYVDRQVVRDANHLEVQVVAEGRPVLVQVLLKSDAPMPQLKGMLVRAKGVYFARSENDRTGPNIELWVQQNEDVKILGSLEHDERFNLPVTPLGRLAAAPPGKLVHVTGTLESQEPGKSLTLLDGPARATLRTAQTETLRVGDRVEAIGLPEAEAGRWVLEQALFRDPQTVLTSVNQLWQLPAADAQKWYRARFEYLVYYYDPRWKALWGRSGDSDDYLSLGSEVFPIKAGQRILVEGSVRPANGAVVDHPKVTILQESVPLEPR